MPYQAVKPACTGSICCTAFRAIVQIAVRGSYSLLASVDGLICAFVCTLLFLNISPLLSAITSRSSYCVFIEHFAVHKADCVTLELLSLWELQCWMLLSQVFLGWRCIPFSVLLGSCSVLVGHLFLLPPRISVTIHRVYRTSFVNQP